MAAGGSRTRTGIAGGEHSERRHAAHIHAEEHLHHIAINMFYVRPAGTGSHGQPLYDVEEAEKLAQQRPQPSLDKHP